MNNSLMKRMEHNIIIKASIPLNILQHVFLGLGGAAEFCSSHLVLLGSWSGKGTFSVTQWKFEE